ncbi:MAG: ATP-binding cassette domain-containing protein [Bradymonadia bacterium]
MSVLSIDVRVPMGTGRDLVVAFEVPGPTTALLGPNGAGKTTLLRAVLGLVPSARGRVALGEQQVWGASSARARAAGQVFGWVPQGLGLCAGWSPRRHLTFAVNARFGVEAHVARRGRVEHALEAWVLTAFADRPAAQLSGGERQRLALARSLVVEPRALLLDEPLAALDAEARVEARARLADRLRTLACPVLLVTHDPEDVRVLATRVVLLAQGRLETAAAERGQGAGAS